MTFDPNEPTRAREFPSLEKSPPPVDPYAPVDYPSTYPPPPPPPSYPAPYPGYPPAAFDPYSSGRPQGTNGMAIGALVTSLVGLLFCGLVAPVGLILGVMGMRETKRTGQEGHGLALAGVILGGVAVAIWLVVIVIYIIAVAAYVNTPQY